MSEGLGVVDGGCDFACDSMSVLRGQAGGWIEAAGCRDHFPLGGGGDEWRARAIAALKKAGTQMRPSESRGRLRRMVRSVVVPPADMAQERSSEPVRARTQATQAGGAAVRRSSGGSRAVLPFRAATTTSERSEMTICSDPRTRHTRVMIRVRVDRSAPISRDTAPRSTTQPGTPETSGRETQDDEQGRCQWKRWDENRNPSVEGKEP